MDITYLFSGMIWLRVFSYEASILRKPKFFAAFLFLPSDGGGAIGGGEAAV